MDEKHHQWLGTFVAGRSELLLLGTIFKESFCKVASCCFYMILTDSYLLYMDNLSFFGRSYNDFHIWKVFLFLGTLCKFYTILFFSQLFTVTSPDNLSPYQGTCFSQVATNFTFTSETSILLLLKCLPSNATKKSLLKILEHKLGKAFSDGIRDVQLGRFILLSVSISQQLPRLTSLSFFSFLNWPLKHDCTFRWQHSGGSEQLTTLESWKLFSCK